MPRKPREKSPTDHYHVMMRGINKERIFDNPKHKNFLLDLLETHIKENNIEILAYCIMNNHLHLVLQGDLTDISAALKKVNIRFAMRLNKDQDRVGHVFQDRYKSEVIYNDQHLLQAIKYVHNNPVKAKMTNKPEDYKWSSYRFYLGKGDKVISKESREIIIEIAGGYNRFVDFHQVNDYKEFIDTNEELENNRLEHAQGIISGFFKEHGIEEVDDSIRDLDLVEDLIEELLEKSRLSHRRIADMLQLNSNMVHGISGRMNADKQKEPSPMLRGRRVDD